MASMMIAEVIALCSRPETWSAAEARARIRSGSWRAPTAGLAAGYVQANLAVLPLAFAEDFRAFCLRNPRALPLLDVTEPGSPIPKHIAPEADVRCDLPRYRVFRNGALSEEVTDLLSLWRDDFVAFLIGCSFTFDATLSSHGVPVRHVDLGCNVPMYVTNRETVPSGPFSGPLVVSMRPIPRADVDRVVEITRSLPAAHGEPILIGSPEALGIGDLQCPDFGHPVPVADGETPVFWACGVTAMEAVRRGRIPLMIAHAPGHMLISDLVVCR